MQEERTFLRKIGSRKKLLEEKISKLVESMTPKEANQQRKEEIETMKGMMDQNFKGVQAGLEDARRKGDGSVLENME